MTSTPPPPPPYDPSQGSAQASGQPGQFGPAPGASPYGGPPPSGPPPAGSYGQAPYGQAPYGQAPYGQAPYGQAPYGGAPAPGPSPYAATPTAPTQPLAPFWVVLFGVLAVLGIVAVLLPWFHPTLDGHKIDGIKDFHSWNGILFFIAPILMFVAAVRAVTARNNVAQFRQAGVTGLISGVLLLVSGIIGYVRVPGAYSDWDQAKSVAAEHGETLGRGPELGWYLTLGVGVLFVVLGVAAVLQAKRRAG